MSEGYTPGTVIPGFVDAQEWAACFGMSWADLLLYDQAGPQRIIRDGGKYFRNIAGCMGVASARNEIAHNFLATDGEWLFMVDTDMGFEPTTVDRLVASAEANKVPVLGALCFAQKKDPDLIQGPMHAARLRIQPTIYRYAEIEKTGERGFRSVTKYFRDSFQYAAGTGAACILIHRSALLAVGPEPFMPITDPIGAGNGMPRTFSEDLSFCVRVQGAGMEMGVDTSIKTTHYKGGIFLDEVTFAMQEETLIQAKGQSIARQVQAYERAGLVIPRGLAL